MGDSSDKSGGEGGVFPNEGVKFMVGGRGDVDGQVGVTGHSLLVEDAEGIATEGSVGLTVFEGGSLLWLVALCLLLGSG